jgi:CheY-like chemotaxis protein
MGFKTYSLHSDFLVTTPDGPLPARHSTTKDAIMYGLADRITRSDTATDPGIDGAVVQLFPRAGVLVVERDPSTSALVERHLAGCDIAVARDASTALARLGEVRPAVILLDLGIPEAELEALADGLAKAGLDAIPLIMLDPAEPVNGDALIARVRAAFHVTRRVWFGGGLRSRMAA